MEWYQRHGSTDDVILRLYWLLRAVPAVDPEQDPCHWLALGLRRNWNGPCRELYLREIERRPAEALGERFTALLECAVPLFTLADWLDWRWQAAGCLGHWLVISMDLQTMRPRFCGHDDLTWARLLVNASNQVAWVLAPGAEALFEQWAAELEQMTHVHALFDLSRLDMLRDLSSGWKRLFNPAIPNALHRLIPLSWTRPFAEVRPALLALLADLVASPETSLMMLDTLRDAAPLVLGQFGQLVEQLRYQPGFHYHQDRPGLERIMREFLEETSFFDTYNYFRREMLRFFLREALLVDPAVEALTRHADLISQQGHNYLYQIREDWPLRILCMAHCCFWGCNV